MMRYPIVMAVCAACIAAAVAGPSGQESEARRVSVTQHRAAPAVDPARSADWSDHNGDLANSRYAPLTDITPENASRLALAWSFETPEYRIRQQTPLVVDGVMYFSSGSTVFALDAATGEPVWTFEMEPRFGGGGRGPGYGDGRIYAIGGPFVYAVDAKTGALVESFGDNGVLPAVSRALVFKYPDKYPPDVDPVSMGYRINNPPKFHNGTVFLGTSDSDSLIVGGLLIAVDAETGAVKWVFNTVPQGPDDDGWELSKDTWIGGVRHGGGVWTQPAIDPELDMIFFNGANPAPDYDGSARKGLNLFTNSIIALRLSTGALLWHFQMIHHDIWDKDMAAGPVLFDATVNGRTVKGLGSTGKICFMYMLNRETGTPINPIVETAVPTTTDVPGEEVWPTQPIPYTQRHVPQTPYCAVYPKVADPELAKRVRPLYHPYLANEFVITSPGQDGGADYGGPAFSPRTGLLYVSGKNDAVSNRVKPVGATLRPGPRSPGHFENLAGTEAHGMEWNQALTAYEPVSGELVWYSEFPGWTNAAHTVAGDVIFHGTGGAGDLIAFDARSGEQVWRYAGDFGPPDGIRTGIMATPMTYRVNGKQYVTVMALDQVLTFALP